MREIVHIQAGALANYIGTHYFNTLEAYFTSEVPENEQTAIAHDVSFREGIAPDGTETFCPRLLLFDYKQNFGALSQVSALYGGTAEAEEDAAWSGPLEVNRQPGIEKSDYQARLEKEEHGEKIDEPAPHAHNVRFWSDFNRVYHAPHSLHPLPSPAPGGNTTQPVVQQWDEGIRLFRRQDSDSEIMEGDFRHFVEECDLLQGFQVSFDNDTFGSFMLEMAENVHDEMPKAPILTFANLSKGRVSDADPQIADQARRIINESLALVKLDDLSNLTIPLESPQSWAPGAWSSYLDADFHSSYHASAILAAHIESITLPLRLKASDVDMRLFTNTIQGGDLHFAQLSGALPIVCNDTALAKLEASVHDFTVGLDYTQAKTGPAPQTSLFSLWNVVRGLSTDENERIYKQADILRYPGSNGTYTPLAYPMPTSYPQFFDTRLLSSDGRRTSLSALGNSSPSKPTTTTLASVPIYSAFKTTPSLGRLFAARASFVSDFLRTGADVNVLGPGLGREELRELREDLVRISETFGGVEDADNEGGDGDGGDFEYD